MKEFRENIFLTLKLKLSLGTLDFLFKKTEVYFWKKITSQAIFVKECNYCLLIFDKECMDIFSNQDLRFVFTQSARDKL